MSETLYQITGRHRAEVLPERKPSWLKVKAPGGPQYLRLKQLMRDLDLHTVCEEAHCPNVGECWEHGTATFMILGDVCTRNCAYCAVAHGRPPKYDITEPSRVADAIGEMRLQHAVITSVDRDDLPDFGAYIFAETIRQIKNRLPDCSVEVLVPDFQGRESSIQNPAICTTCRLTAHQARGATARSATIPGDAAWRANTAAKATAMWCGRAVSGRRRANPC